ncbi:hypothetical protein ACS0TY_002537 [Phlomoides rotata]
MYSSCYDGSIRLMDVEKEVFDMVYSSEYSIYSISQSTHDVKSLHSMWLLLTFHPVGSVLQQPMLMIKLASQVELIMRTRVWYTITIRRADGFPHSGIIYLCLVSVNFTSCD